MLVILVEPCFPPNQREFARGLFEVGATVVGIGERPTGALDDGLRHWLHHYEQIPSVVDEEALCNAVRWVQGHATVDRIEATVEAHILSTAHVREACGIPGTSTRTAYLCRDKPAMKEVLRAEGIACAGSIGTTEVCEVRAFAAQVGYPVILKPRDAAGASGTYRADDPAQLEAAMKEVGVDRGRAIAVEEFVEGHEGFYDTLTVDGRVVHDFVSHYYPNVLEAMRTRWISPQFVSTNRVDQAPFYEQVREMGRRVIRALGIGTSATHMEWFHGPKGLRFSEIGCRPPGVRAWDLYGAGNDMDLYREWAQLVVHGAAAQRPSRRFAAGIIALRPDRDGVICGYDGLAEIQQHYGEWILDGHFPPVGTPTQGVEAGYMANAWMRMRHPDYDHLREMLDRVGEMARVRAQ